MVRTDATDGGPTSEGQLDLGMPQSFTTDQLRVTLSPMRFTISCQVESRRFAIPIAL